MNIFVNIFEKMNYSVNTRNENSGLRSLTSNFRIFRGPHCVSLIKYLYSAASDNGNVFCLSTEFGPRLLTFSGKSANKSDLPTVYLRFWVVFAILTQEVTDTYNFNLVRKLLQAKFLRSYPEEQKQKCLFGQLVVILASEINIFGHEPLNISVSFGVGYIFENYQLFSINWSCLGV